DPHGAGDVAGGAARADDPAAAFRHRPQHLSLGGHAAERAGADAHPGGRSQGLLSLPVRLLNRLDRELGDGASLVAILDYDGTLTPLVATPGQARLAPSVRQTLARLAEGERTRLAILSRRGLADLPARVALPGVVYGGRHVLAIAGRHLRFRHPGARPSRLTATRRALVASLPSIPGARLEWKGLAVSLHYRRVAPETRPRVKAIATRIVRD